MNGLLLGMVGRISFEQKRLLRALEESPFCMTTPPTGGTRCGHAPWKLYLCVLQSKWRKSQSAAPFPSSCRGGPCEQLLSPVQRLIPKMYRTGRYRSLPFLAVHLLLLLLGDSSAQCPSDPFPCLCTFPVTEVDCTPRDGRRYTAIPTDSAVGTESLTMDMNNLTQVNNLQLYRNLTFLSLRNNRISELGQESFANLTRLATLVLEGNPLQTLRGPLFSDLMALQLLNLRNAALEELGEDTLTGLNQLQTLQLDDNRLRQLPEGIFTSVPQLSSVVLRNNQLNTLPESTFSALTGIYSLDVVDNLLSCDRALLWLYNAQNTSLQLVDPLDTLCHWPDYLRGQPLTTLTPGDFIDFAPTLESGPADTTVLTTTTVVLPCNVTAQPRPVVTWFKDTVTLVRSDGYLNASAAASAGGRLTVLGDGSLEIQLVQHQDQGSYSCMGTNPNGTVSSNTSFLTVLESTCFNGAMDIHETDVDCGGVFCEPCNSMQSCLEDSDCAGDLVCLYAHQLASLLDYISLTDMRAFTCAAPLVPAQLLEQRLQSALIRLGYPVAMNETGEVIRDNLRSFLSQSLNVQFSVINSVDVTTVPRQVDPLIQIHFSVTKSSDGDEAVAALVRELDGGYLLGTLRVDRDLSDLATMVRLNV